MLRHMTRDTHYYQVQHEKSAILVEIGLLSNAYETLKQENRTLQAQYYIAIEEKEEALKHLRSVLENESRDQTVKASDFFEEENDKLRLELWVVQGCEYVMWTNKRTLLAQDS